MGEQKTLHDGCREGLARAFSQMCTYPLEARKACIQVYGQHTPKLINYCRGMLQSSLTSGVIFTSYFTVYNSLHPNPLASSIAAFCTSFMKIPVSNCMRVMQVNQHHKNILDSGRKIMYRRGVKGLYNGYGVSLLEDVVETNIRNMVYELGKNTVPCYHPNMGFLTGAIAGGLGAAITTPFDTVRANMAQASIGKDSMDLYHTTQRLVFSKEGPKTLFRGMYMRASSNALRYALFYLIMEYLYVKI